MTRSLGLHHIHRKNQALNRGDCVEKCMNKCEKKHFMTLSHFDRMMIGVAILYPLTMLPQIIKIFVEQDAGSISVLSFALKLIFIVPWFVYGILHKSPPILWSNIMWAMIYVIILAQTFIY